jgi:hypothetical protein
MQVLSLSLIAALGLSACATGASRGDYAAYREVRLAEDARERREAIAEYLEAHPGGQWSGELREQHLAAETAVYDEHKSSAEGLRYYLRVYPDGRFAEQAEARLSALTAVQGNRAREAEVDREVQRRRREEALAERREWASDAISYWTRILMNVERWGEPIGDVAQANDDFDEAFRTEPTARCSETECIKFYELSFAVPVPGQTRIERDMRLLLRLRFEGEERRLVRAEMLMPNRGFSRWYELQNTEFVEAMDPEQRLRTIDWALERLIPWVREQAPQAQAIDVVPEPIDPPTVGAEGEAVSTETEGELVLPIALQGLRNEAGVKIVIFAAADADEGPAYDGFYIEHVAEEEE